ncbi:MAG: bifunctional metallophosphatase/5'-nucleotidase [Oscillospiraceae bacterium]|nr:bifunctional metallophosphatase/5'-nucleotidase [Oscillospiraceae bacterium]
MKRIAPLLLIAVMLISLSSTVSAAPTSENIVLIYTNDVHCAVDPNVPEGTMGYSNLAALKKELSSQNAYVALIDAGDAIQGDAIGTLSDGGYLVDIMNALGYDYLTFGNHEFDYGMDVALSLQERSTGQYLSCNLMDLTTGTTVAEPYALATYGDLTIGYVGISTPETLSKSSPVHFQDEDGNYTYGFCEGDEGQALYDAVQSAVDDATAEGADLIIAIGHLGTDPASSPWTSEEVIANTTGIHAFIDGHSHSVIEGKQVPNAKGENVLLTSTGTKLQHIGVMTISPDGQISTQLVTGFTATDPEMDAYIDTIQSQYETKLQEVIGCSQVDLVTHDPATGERIIRSGETNLGDLVADAYRTVLGADIGMVNGGGIRATLSAGDITYGDLIAIHPYGNMMCVVEATGQELLDTLEVSAMYAPEENGSFLHVSGLRFTIDLSIPSSVTLDDHGMLTSIGDTRRVRDVQVLQPDGTYAPLDPSATYTLASHDYMIKENGCSVDFFSKNTLLQDQVLIDNQVLISYIQDHLDGQIGAEYADPYGQGRITITEAPSKEEIPKTDDLPTPLPLLLILLPLVYLLPKKLRTL